MKESLGELGYAVNRQQLGVFRDGSRFFGTLDLESTIAPGVSLAVGVRNSVDKSFPLGFVAGSRVFVCDNLAFRSELLVRRRHTINGERDFLRRITGSVAALRGFVSEEADRINQLAGRVLTELEADSLILRSWECGIITVNDLPKVLREWRNPSHEEFVPRTAWSLYNAYTAALNGRSQTNPQAHSVATMRVARLFGPAMLN